MRQLRIVAILLGIALMLGESWRSFGHDRPLVFLLDDQIAGLMLIVSAYFMSKDTTRRRASFAAAWAVTAGMLYQGFFGKILSPETIDPGSFTAGQLVLLSGIALLISIIGAVVAIVHPRVH